MQRFLNLFVLACVSALTAFAAEPSAEALTANYLEARAAWEHSNWAAVETNLQPLFPSYRGADLWRLHYLWGVMLLRTQRFDIAEQQFRRIVPLAPDAGRAALTLYHQAIAEAYAGKLDVSFATLRGVSADFPELALAPTLKSDTLLFGALIAYNLHHRPLALLMAGYGRGLLKAEPFAAMVGQLSAKATIDELSALLARTVDDDTRVKVIGLEAQLPQWQPSILGDAFDLPEPVPGALPSLGSALSAQYGLGFDLLSYHQNSVISGDRSQSTKSFALAGGLAWQHWEHWALIGNAELQLIALQAEVVGTTPREASLSGGLRRRFASEGNWSFETSASVRYQTQLGIAESIGYTDLTGAELAFGAEYRSQALPPLRFRLAVAFFRSDEAILSTGNRHIEGALWATVRHFENRFARALDLGVRIETLQLRFTNGDASETKTSLLARFSL